jgi:hypothetical protein
LSIFVEKFSYFTSISDYFYFKLISDLELLGIGSGMTFSGSEDFPDPDPAKTICFGSIRIRIHSTASSTGFYPTNFISSGFLITIKEHVILGLLNLSTSTTTLMTRREPERSRAQNPSSLESHGAYNHCSSSNI